PIRRIRIGEVTIGVTVVMANPGHGEGQIVFAAALGNQVQVAVRIETGFGAAGVSGISVENIAVLVFVENADAGSLSTGKFRHVEVVVHLALRQLFLGERRVVVVIEVGLIRRDPGKTPAEALFEGFDFRQRRARDGGEADVALREMRDRAVKAIGDHRATGTAFIPFRAEHEVVDDELAATTEKIGEGFLAGGRIEDVVLLDLEPRELAALPGDVVAQASQFLFFGEKFFARGHPFGGRDDFVVLQRGGTHDCFSFGFIAGLSFRKLLSLRAWEITVATTPPLEVAVATITATLAMHTGQNMVSLPSTAGNRGRLEASVAAAGD